MVHIYTGNGKGKTTAALGLIVRALGRGMRVCLIQFMKKNFEYGEIRTLQSLEGVEVHQFGTDQLVNPEDPAPVDFNEANAACVMAERVLREKAFDMVVLDEINVAVAWNLLPVDSQLALFDLAEDTELVMTGRYADTRVIGKADLVTEMVEVKHYFSRGVPARTGIEY